jgi:Phage integrase family
MLAVLLYHDLRATELFSLRVKDYAARRGIGTLVVHRKGSKLRYIPVHPKAVAAVNEYLAECPHAGEEAAPLFIPSPERGQRKKPMLRQRVRELVERYSKGLELPKGSARPHALRETAANRLFENRDAFLRCRFQQLRVEAGKRCATTLGKFQISCIVNRQIVFARQGERFHRNLFGSFLVFFERQSIDQGQRLGDPFRGDSATPLGHQKTIANFEPPVRRNPCVCTGFDFLPNDYGLGVLLIGQKPCERYRRINDQRRH